MFGPLFSQQKGSCLHTGGPQVIGRLLTGGATVKPDDVWAALLLGNLRGARRLAKASNYSWAVLRRGCWLVAGPGVFEVSGCGMTSVEFQEPPIGSNENRFCLTFRWCLFHMNPLSSCIWLNFGPFVAPAP